MFLHVVSHNRRFRVVHNSFRRSIQTLHKHFYQVLYAVGELRSEIIKGPSSATHPKVLGSHRWNPYLKVIVYLGFISCSYSLFSLTHLFGFRIVLVPMIAHMCWQGCYSKCYGCCGL
jgi:hypothetical protein